VLRRLAALFPRLRPLLPAWVIAAGWPACTSREGPLVAFLGDSLTSGWRLREEEAYPALVARSLAARGHPIRVINAGVSGDTATRAHARLRGVLRHRPDVLVVALGANDGLSREPLVATEAALERIVVEARAAGSRVLLVGVRLGTGEAAPHVGDTAGDEARARTLSGIFPRVAAARRVPLVPDLLAGVAGEPDLLFPDRLHPNAAGQARLAENVRPQLELLLAEVRAGRVAGPG
jgi:acyl-CoA thioesterase-1